MTIKEAATGAAFTILASVVTYYISDYQKLKDFKREEELRKEIEAEKKALDIAFSKLDSIYKLKKDVESAYKAHYDSTFSQIQNYIQEDDSLTKEAIRVVSDSSSQDNVDSIYNELKKRKL